MTMRANVYVDVGAMKRLILGIVVVVIGLFMGRNIPSQPMLITALLGLFILLFVIVTRPINFILLLMFFLFEAFDLVDVERFARLPGLFKAKDFLIALLAGFTLVNIAMHHFPRGVLKRSRLFWPLMFFLLFVVGQFLRTYYLLGEKPMLLFRQGRHFLTYALPFILILFITRDQDWRRLDRWCLFFIFLITALNFVDSVIIRLPFFHSVSVERAKTLGVIKSYNPALLLTYWMFFRRFWLYCFHPGKRNLIWLVVMGAALIFYFFRGTVAASLMAILAVSLLVPPRIRARSFVVITTAAVSLTILSVLAVSVSQALSRGDALAAFRRYMMSTGTDVIRGEGTYASRIAIDRFRYPLIKKNPFVGMGFISVFGEVAYTLWRTEGVLPVGTSDTGWLDLMLRLGLIGSLLLLAVFAKEVHLIRHLLKEKRDWSDEERSLLLANATLAIAASLNLITAAHLSWEPSITLFGITLAWTMRFEQKALPKAQGEGSAEAAPGGIKKAIWAEA
jgi:hypothetical protein